MKAEITAILGGGITLNKKETRRLLKSLRKIESSVGGYKALCAQLGEALKQPKWNTITISAPSISYVLDFGVVMGMERRGV